MCASIAAAAMEHGYGCVYVTLCFVSGLIKLPENCLCIASINLTTEVCRIVIDVSEISVRQLLLGEGCDYTNLFSASNFDDATQIILDFTIFDVHVNYVQVLCFNFLSISSRWIYKHAGNVYVEIGNEETGPDSSLITLPQNLYLLSTTQ